MRKIAIMMRMKMDGESLNNEGNIGNVIQTRQISVLGGGVRDAISGEMLKHYHSRNLTLLADQEELCDTCKIFSPMKNAKVEENEGISASGSRVKACIVDDVHGFMNAGKSRNEKRNSVIKFSWAIATEDSESQTKLQTRVDVTDKNNAKKVKGKTTSSANTITEQNTQMIMHKPIRSNEYAITIQVELDRVGFDDEFQQHVFEEDIIKARQKKVVAALKNMFLDMEGALCATRLPHISNIEGVVVDKQNKDEVLVKYSALNDDFKFVNEKLATNSRKFDNIIEFAEALDSLI